MPENRIQKPSIEKDENGKIKRVAVGFGPHYFIDIMLDEEGVLKLYLGATHHGFGAAANEVNGQLERIVNEVMNSHPEISF